MDELELLFEDEASVYLPKVVADENERKENEKKRIANENERIANEKERISNETDRVNSMSEMEKQFSTLIADLEAEYKKISYIKEYKSLFITETTNENTFDLPSICNEKSIIWVYVNGMKLSTNEYTIDLDNLKLILTKALDVIGTEVEIVVFKLTTALEEDYDTLRGERGYTPMRGIDYWTEEDVSAMEEESKSYIDSLFSNSEEDVKNYIDSQFSNAIDEINGEVV